MLNVIELAKKKYIKSLNTTRPPTMDELNSKQTVISLENAGLSEVPDLSCFRIA